MSTATESRWARTSGGRDLASLDARRSSQARRNPTDDDSTLTPIFHALSVGGWNQPPPQAVALHRPMVEPAPDPIAAFELDPLHAPIPAQTMAGLAQVRALRPVSGGRHRA